MAFVYRLILNTHRSEEKVAICVVFHACNRALVAFQKDRPHLRLFAGMGLNGWCPDTQEKMKARERLDE